MRALYLPPAVHAGVGAARSAGGRACPAPPVLIRQALFVERVHGADFANPGTGYVAEAELARWLGVAVARGCGQRCGEQRGALGEFIC